MCPPADTAGMYFGFPVYLRFEFKVELKKNTLIVWVTFLGGLRLGYNSMSTVERLHIICFIYGISPYRAVNTSHHGYKNQSFNDVLGKSRCLFWDPYKTLNAKRAPCRIVEC